MKKFISLAFCLCMLCGVLAACGGTANEPEVNVPDYAPGVTTDTGWSSDWIGLSYTLGDGFYFASQEEINSMMEFSSDVFLVDDNGNPIVDYTKLNVVYEMMAYDTYGNNVIVGCEKNTANLNEARYYAALKLQLAQANLEYTFSELTDITIGNVAMRRTDAYTEAYGTPTYQTYLLKAYGDRIISIIVSSVDEATVDAMISAFK